MQSTPAVMHARIPASPWACAATLSPARWASSTMAASSSSEYCCAPASPLCDITPPDAEILISRAPYLIWYRTALRTSGTPLAMPSSTLSGMMSGARRWNIVGSR